MDNRLLTRGAQTLVLGVTLGFLLGLLVAVVRLWGYSVGRDLVFWPILCTSLNSAVLLTVAGLVVWWIAFQGLRGLLTKEPARSLVAALIPSIPAVLFLLRWVNHEALPGLTGWKSLALNAGVVLAALLALPFAARALMRWSARPAGLIAPRVGLGLCGLLLVANAVRALTGGREGTNVIVILVDVLRADHLRCYGYQRETSPNLDRFAAESVLFEQAVAQSTFTKTSVASLFTGLYAFHHQVYEGGSINADALSARLTTWAEPLAYEGFLTVAWVENPQLRAYMGFDQGFAEYHDQPGDIETIADEFLAWLEDWGGRERFFAYLHVLDLHGPYHVDPPFQRMFGHYTDKFDAMEWREWRQYNKDVMDGEIDPTQDEIEQLRALYDGQIAFIDQELQRIFDGIKAQGLWDESMIIVTADHGEGFMEHGFFTHTNTPYEELIRVPLIIKLPQPKEPGRRISEQVALVDVAPTIEDFAAISMRVERDGVSLMPLLEGLPGPSPLDQREYVYSELNNRMAIRNQDWKFIHLRPGRPNELFDLSADPGEKLNVIEQHPDFAAFLEAMAEAAMKERESGEPEKILVDPATVERLKALGYM